MQNRYVLFSLMAVFLALFIYGCGGGSYSYTPPVATCSDTDGGNVIDVAGVVTVTTNGVTTTYTDTCAAADRIGEYYCTSGNISGYSGQYCPSGRCVNGACTAVAPPQTCSDSDGGNNINLSGTVTITNSSGSFTFTDNCASSSIVNEQYCSGNNVATAQGYCPNGQVCSNGVCTTTPDSCSDSDGGINTGVFGTISGVYWGAPFSITDYCQDANVIVENYCNNNAPYNQLARCPMNQTCQGGVCV